MNNGDSVSGNEEEFDSSPVVGKIRQAGKWKSGREFVKEALFIDILDDRVMLKMQNCGSVGVDAVGQGKRNRDKSKGLLDTCKNWEEGSIKVLKDVVITAKLRVYGMLQTNFMRFRRNIQGLPLREKRKSKDSLNYLIFCVRKQTRQAYDVWNVVEKMWKKKLRLGFVNISRVRNEWVRKVRLLYLRALQNHFTSIVLYSIKTKYRKQEVSLSSKRVFRIVGRFYKSQLKVSFSIWRNLKNTDSVVPKQSRHLKSYSIALLVLLVAFLIDLYYNYLFA